MVVTSNDGWSVQAPPPPAPLPRDVEASSGLRLRYKGLMVLAALAALIALLFGLVLAYRASMEQDFERLERARQVGVLSAGLAQTQALALAEVASHLGSGLDVALDIGATDRLLARLVRQAQALRSVGATDVIDIDALNRARAMLAERSDRQALLALRAQLEAGVEAMGRQAHAREALASAQVARVYERGRAVAVALAVAAALGVALIGVVVVFFFTRLAADIGRLHTRALAVVGGDRRDARTIDRDDELGELGTAIDVTVAALAARERELETERRNAIDREKMATIGALSAGVLNDIGNPIAAIDGFARTMRDEREAGALHFDNALCDPEHILHQTARLQTITRQIAQLAAPPSSQSQLLSLNDVVANALLLVRYDPRVGDARIDTELDPQLPAVDGVGDRLVQLMLNLVVATVQSSMRQRGAQPLIRVKSERVGTQVQVTIADNREAMHLTTSLNGGLTAPEPTSAERAEEAGVRQSREIAAQHGGTLQFETAGGGGSVAVLRLPIGGLGA